MKAHLSFINNPARSLRFGMVVCGLLLFFSQARVLAYTVSPDHPRVWLTPERLSRLQDYAERNTARWQKVKQAADSALRSSANNPDDIPPLALAYQVTGDTNYAQKAIAILVARAVPEYDLTADSYYPYRSVLPDMAAGLDWCYDRMTAAQRRQVAGWLMDRADAVWPETNPARLTGWAVNNPANNYFYGFMMTWPAALAAYGDDARAAFHIDLALTKYRTRVRSYTDNWGTGGVFAESTNYDSTFRLALVLDAHLSATGEDLINEPDFTFLGDSLYWRIYSTVPTRDLYYPLGDQPRVSIGPLSDYDRDRALIPMATVADDAAVQYAKYWLDTMSPSISQWSFTVTWEFLYYDEDAPSADYTAALPLAYFANGPGLLVRRSSWNTDATYWGIWAGPLREGHQNFDVNGFMIFKGGWLAGNDSIWSHSGILSATINQNNFTFGGMGQAPQSPDVRWPDEAGWTVAYEDTDEYTYFAGWGAQAYVQDHSHGGIRIVDDYTRKMVYLAPDLFLVYDRVRLVNPSLSKEWHMHARNAIAVDGRSYRFDNGRYRLFGQALLPTSDVTVDATPIYAGTSGALSSYRLNVVSNNSETTDYLLNVLQIAPVTQSDPPLSRSVNVAFGNMDGAAVGNWVILLGKADNVDPPVDYGVSSGVATQHLLVDLVSDTDYRVRITDRDTGATTFSTRRTSPRGSLRFSVPAGNYQVLINLP